MLNAGAHKRNRNDTTREKESTTILNVSKEEMKQQIIKRSRL
jgi:hypothetical protein